MKLVTIPEVQRVTGISRARIVRAIENGGIGCIMIGNRHMVDIEEVIAYFNKERYVMIDRVMEITGLSERQVRNAIRMGWLPAVKGPWGWGFDEAKVIKAVRTRLEANRHDNRGSIEPPDGKAPRRKQ